MAPLTLHLSDSYSKLQDHAAEQAKLTARMSGGLVTKYDRKRQLPDLQIHTPTRVLLQDHHRPPLHRLLYQPKLDLSNPDTSVFPIPFLLVETCLWPSLKTVAIGLPVISTIPVRRATM